MNHLIIDLSGFSTETCVSGLDLLPQRKRGERESHAEALNGHTIIVPTKTYVVEGLRQPALALILRRAEWG